MNSATLLLVLALLAVSVYVATQIVNSKLADTQRLQNAAFIAAQRAQNKKEELEQQVKEEESKQEEEVPAKISSWETLNTKPPEIVNRPQEESGQPPQPEVNPIVNVKKRKHVNELWQAEPNEDDKNIAENLFASVKDDEENEESMYSYKNLTHAHTLSRREMLPVRDAWSRADNTNPKQWESQVQFMRDEIKASGQSLEEFKENTLMPLPEQFTALWESEEPTKRNKVDPSIPKPPPKYAATEAASLVRDATQYVHFENAELASQSMIEIAKAIKRSSALGVVLPSLPQSTADAVKKWSSSDDELARQSALALVNVI
jgi:hypothetical protein